MTTTDYLAFELTRLRSTWSASELVEECLRSSQKFKTSQTLNLLENNRRAIELKSLEKRAEGLGVCDDVERTLRLWRFAGGGIQFQQLRVQKAFLV